MMKNGSLLIHKGKLPTKFPLRLKVIAKDNEVLMPTLLGLKKHL